MTGSMKIVTVAMLSAALGACGTWDGLSRTEKDTAIGAAAGGVLGGVVTDSALGTLGGAAVGGVVGNQVGKHRD